MNKLMSKEAFDKAGLTYGGIGAAAGGGALAGGAGGYALKDKDLLKLFKKEEPKGLTEEEKQLFIERAAQINPLFKKQDQPPFKILQAETHQGGDMFNSVLRAAPIDDSPQKQKGDPIKRKAEQLALLTLPIVGYMSGKAYTPILASKLHGAATSALNKMDLALMGPELHRAVPTRLGFKGLRRARTYGGFGGGLISAAGAVLTDYLRHKQK